MEEAIQQRTINHKAFQMGIKLYPSTLSIEVVERPSDKTFCATVTRHDIFKDSEEIYDLIERGKFEIEDPSKLSVLFFTTGRK